MKALTFAFILMLAAVFAVGGVAFAECQNVYVDGQYHRICYNAPAPAPQVTPPPQQSPGVDAWGNIIWSQEAARAISEDQNRLRRERFEREMQERQFQHEREMKGPQSQPTDVQCPGNTFWNGYGCTSQ